MAKAADTIKHCKREASSAKSRLMELYSTLCNTPGCAGEAKRLEAIIGRLELWQNTGRVTA